MMVVLIVIAIILFVLLFNSDSKSSDVKINTEQEQLFNQLINKMSSGKNLEDAKRELVNEIAQKKEVERKKMLRKKIEDELWNRYEFEAKEGFFSRRHFPFIKYLKEHSEEIERRLNEK